MYIIRKRIQLPPEKAMFLFVNKVLPQTRFVANMLASFENECLVVSLYHISYRADLASKITVFLLNVVIFCDRFVYIVKSAFQRRTLVSSEFVF